MPIAQKPAQIEIIPQETKVVDNAKVRLRPIVRLESPSRSASQRKAPRRHPGREG